MSRWFRHYAGMMRDEKLVGVAIRSKQPVERVVWVWGAILESAAEVDDGGAYELDAAECAYFLRADEADILAVVSALVSAGRVAENRVVKWGDRQFSSDRSKERVAAYRERKRGEGVQPNVTTEACDGGVTLHNGGVTVQETETETETEKNTQSSVPSDCVVAPKKSKPEKSKIDSAAKILAGGIGEVLAAMVIDHRKAKKAPITSRAAELLVKAFNATGDPSAAVDMMISRNWTGFEIGWWENERNRTNLGSAPDSHRGSASFRASGGHRHEPPSYAEAFVRGAGLLRNREAVSGNGGIHFSTDTRDGDVERGITIDH